MFLLIYDLFKIDFQTACSMNIMFSNIKHNIPLEITLINCTKIHQKFNQSLVYIPIDFLMEHYVLDN